MPRRRPSPPLELQPAEIERIAAALVETVRREGAFPLSKLAAHGVPKGARSAALARCAAEGLDVGARLVRVPLIEQLHARLADGATLPMRALRSAVQGGTQKEVAQAAAALVRRGDANLVLRGTQLSLMPATAMVLSATGASGLEADLAAMIKAIKGARKARAALLTADVDARVNEWAARLRAAVTAKRERGVGLDRVLEETRRLAEPTGLTFVPALVRALGGETARDAVHDALRSAALRGAIELRPESGLGRLSPEDLALCVAGPQGSHLSWARAVEGP
jgi:hypothetical protein